MEDRLKELYQSVILAQAKKPVRYEKKENADFTVDANNPICGDRFKFYLNVEGGLIKEAYFYGHGCAISKASSSILTQRLQGCTLAEAKLLCTQMQELLSPEDTGIEYDEELMAFAAAKHFPGRAQCATLSWEKVYAFLNSF